MPVPTSLAPGWVRRIVSSSLFLALLGGGVRAVRGEKVEQLQPQGYVSDFAGALDQETRTRLAALCAEVDQKGRAQIAIVTVHSLEGDAVEEFAVRLFQRWGIGAKGSNRGVLMLLAPSEHKYRIEVGYGLEPILPDGRVGGFGREALPLLRAGNDGGALLLLAQRIAAVIATDAGVALTNAPATPSTALSRDALRVNGFQNLLWILFLLGIPTLRWLLPVFLAGFLGGVGRRRTRYWGGPWFMGGWGGGGSWGGGGFGGGGGGFGGFGGGMSGGGGASGSW